MAAILRFPTSTGIKGVLSITNLEYSHYVKKNNNIRQSINSLKDKWLILYHPNYYDFKFHDDGLFDGIISIESIFKKDDKSTGYAKVMNLSSMSFVPESFKIDRPETKLFDFIHVSRVQADKNIPGFFAVIRKAMDKDPSLTGILISTVLTRSDLNRIRKLYREYFSEEERTKFEFLCLDYDMPFPLSLQTLSYFYRMARVSLNTHLEEKHGRVVGYAIACGLPVVSYPNILECVPSSFRRQPFFYVGEQEVDLADQLLAAKQYVEEKYSIDCHDSLRCLFSEEQSKARLSRHIEAMHSTEGQPNKFYLLNLDRRLAWHAFPYKDCNSLNISLPRLLSFLGSSGFGEGHSYSDTPEVDVANRLKESLGMLSTEYEKVSWKLRFKYFLRLRSKYLKCRSYITRPLKRIRFVHMIYNKSFLRK